MLDQASFALTRFVLFFVFFLLDGFEKKKGLELSQTALVLIDEYSKKIKGRIEQAKKQHKLEQLWYCGRGKCEDGLIYHWKPVVQ